MARLSAIDEIVAASRAVLAAAEDCLTAAGVELPPRRYVSVQGGDWLAGQCADCCHQLVVTPANAIRDGATRLISFAPDRSGAASRRTVEFLITHSAPINIRPAAGRLDLGDVTLDPFAEENVNTHWAESARILAARWALTRSIETAARARLCDNPSLPFRAVALDRVEAWTEGGCAGSKVTVEAQL